MPRSREWIEPSRALARVLCLVASMLGAAGCLAHEIPEGDRPLARTDEPAVALLRRDGALCTGVLVAPRVVLTARHCLRPGAEPPEVIFGEASPIPSVRAEVAPRADLAVLMLARPAPNGVAPLALPSGAADSLRGREATVIGFGRPGLDLDSRKHRAMARIVSDTDGALLIQTAPKQVCHGDSGGPILVEWGGRKVVAAIASFSMDYRAQGGESCAAVLSGARTFEHLAWIGAFVEASADAAALDGDACYFDAHCRAGLSCVAHPDHGALRICAAPCAAGCGKGFDCRDGRCLPSPTPPSVGAACASDAECESGLCGSAFGDEASRCRARCWAGVPSGCGQAQRCASDRKRPTRSLCALALPGDGEGGDERGLGFWAQIVMTGLFVMLLLGVIGRRGRGGRMGR